MSECNLFVCLCCRGLFASHYTETHYLEDGSAVTTSPNVTVRLQATTVSIQIKPYAHRTHGHVHFLKQAPVILLGKVFNLSCWVDGLLENSWLVCGAESGGTGVYETFPYKNV